MASRHAVLRQIVLVTVLITTNTAQVTSCTGIKAVTVGGPVTQWVAQPITAGDPSNYQATHPLALRDVT